MSKVKGSVHRASAGLPALFAPLLTVLLAGGAPLAAQEGAPVVEEGVEIRMEVGPGAVLEEADVRLGLSFRAAATGAPLAAARPVAWLARRSGAGPTSPAECREKAATFLNAKLYPTGGLRAHADVDLNSMFVLTLNRTPELAVLNPMQGFGGMRMHTTVRLDAPGEDWALSPDGRRLFVTMPRVGRVAVVDLDTWNVVARVTAGARPTRISAQPDGALLWVTDEGPEPGVTAIDPATLRVYASVPTGAGPQALAFTPDGRLWVASRGAGTVTVIDTRTAAKVKVLATGALPVDLAYSPADRAVYVAHEGDGTVAAVDAATLDVARRLRLDPGLRAIRFAPAAEAAAGHGGEGGHAGHAGHAGHSGGGGDAAAAGAAPGSERYGFVVNPRAHRVYVLDAASGALVRADSVGSAPDQVAFTDGFAFIRSSASPEVSIIPLVDPRMGGVGPRFTFQAGQMPPAGSAPAAAAAAITPSPDMHDAVFALNAAERRVYYYHYMVSMQMAMPTGSLSTFAFEPRAVLAVRRGLREEGPGRFAATVRLPEPGEYELVLLLDEPRLVRCIGGITVAADTRLHQGEVRLSAEPLVERRELRAGANTLRVRFRDSATGEPLTTLGEVTLIVSSPGESQVRARAYPVEPGTYAFTFDAPAAPVYYLTFELPTVRIPDDVRPTLIFQGGEGSGGGR